MVIVSLYIHAVESKNHTIYSTNKFVREMPSVGKENANNNKIVSLKSV